jgi:hypothetical protein
MGNTYCDFWYSELPRNSSVGILRETPETGQAIPGIIYFWDQSFWIFVFAFSDLPGNLCHPRHVSMVCLVRVVYGNYFCCLPVVAEAAASIK